MAARQRYDERAELAEQAEKYGTFILVNVLWAIVSIPLVTLPAATAGLFAVLSKRARGQPVEMFSEFFAGMREHWRQATALALLDLLVGGLVAANLLVLFPIMDMSDPLAFVARSVTLFAGLMVLLVNLYAWHLLVLVSLPMRGLIQAAFTLVFTYPIWSLGVLVTAALPVGFGLVLPQGVFIIGMVSVTVWIICAGTWRVIRRHAA